MTKSRRHTLSILLTAIYLVAVFSPIAPFALQAKVAAHGNATGRCSGDCGADGCSLERRATHTCCCWQKKRLTNQLHNQLPDADTGTTEQSKPASPGGCCAPQTRDTDKVNSKSAAATHTVPQKAGTASISTGTCGENKLFATGTTDNTPHLPYFFVKENPSPRQSTLTFIPPKRLASLHGKRPDPPPKPV